MFLGEEFDERECKGMCDNCRKGARVIEADRSREAMAIVRLVQTCEQYQQKITVKQASEILRGKKPKKNLLRGDLMDEYLGTLKFMKEHDIKRLIIQMLIMKLLKERFETQNVRGTSVKNIMVYI